MDEMKSNADSDVLVVEPFYCGSHKQLVDCLMKDAGIGSRAHLVTMTGKKWHWRSRVSALYLSTVIPVTHQFRVLFSSSVLNLAELTALRPDLAGLHKVLYFHENQLQYPVRKQKDRDFQYGYNQILSCLVADCILFNSSFNMESFLSSVNSFLKLMPDYRPKGLIDKIRPKCSVLYFPMVYKNITPVDDSCQLRGDTQLMHAFSSDEAHFPQYKAGCCSSKLEMCQDFTDIQSQQEDPADGTHLSGSCGSIGQSQMQFSHHALPDKFEKTLPLAAQSSLMESLACSSADDIVSSHGHGEDENVKNQEKCGGAHQEKVEDLDVPFLNCSEKKQACLHIVWPHRWEHDKDPETFFQVLFRLQTEGVPFVVSVLGETFADVPDIFEEAQKKLKDHIHAWGYQAEKSAYLCILKTADVVVSTSKHEFFGVAMLEAVHHGCYPLCPKALVYPEIYPEECLYSTSTQLYKRLRSFCRHPHLARRSNVNIDIHKFSWDNLRSQYLRNLQIKS